ncbi:MAG TPA: MFS transporter [Thermoleophilaceae bacterium]|nr:MFS transporter [Thermoleophilaceae bacterium]
MSAHASIRLRLLLPLRRREFGLLWTGMAVSLIGDGIYFVAIAWQAYALSNAPTALSLVGVAWTLPTVIFLLFGGAVSDRLERRRVLIAASATEALAIGAIAALSLSGQLQLWMLLVPVAVYGAAEAFFLPAFEAIVPTLVSPDEYTSAAALDNFMRPLAVQLLGPAIGGILIAVASPGVAFVVDACTFLVAVCALLMMRPVERPAAGARSAREAVKEIAEGFRFVRANPWLWGTLAAACLSLLAFFGPYQVLLPYLVKNSLHGGGAMFGAIRAAGGVGAILSAVAIAQAGLPRRCVSFMFAAWSLQALLLVGFAIASGAWLFALIALLGGGLSAAGNVVWGTLMKALVPNEMLGRVSSFDWLVSIGLIPLSFAITGPIASALGAKTTLVLAGVLGCVTTISFLAVPGLRNPERELGGSLASALAGES